MDRRRLSILGTGHLAADVCQGALAGMLPFLISQRGWSFGEASGLVFAMTLASSIIQPVFGGFSDRRRMPHLLPAGVVMAGVGIALVGVLDSYPLAFAAVLLSGLGVAAYHPEAASSARDAAGVRQATGMSMFALGGNLGVAIGPALVTVLVLLFGLAGTLLLALPTLLVAVLLVLDERRSGASRAASAALAAAETPEEATPADAWGPFARLGAAIACRSVVHYGLITFVPLYLVVDLHTSEPYANAALTAMLIAGVAGTLVGGRLADRVGTRRVFATSVGLIPPLIVVLVLSGPALVVVTLVAAGAATIATFSVTVVMGQQMLPGRVGLASGVTLGLAIGTGGLTASLLGLVADAHGLRTVLVIVAAVAVVTVALALTLPRDLVRRPAEPEPRTGGPARASAEAR